jgi:hypothetical protein
MSVLSAALEAPASRFGFGFRGTLAGSQRPRRGDAPRRGSRPIGEVLESRQLLSAVPGFDYRLSGYRWSNPARITYSIPPDGVFWDRGVNRLNAEFDARFGSSQAWHREIARALATWQAVANLNFVPVPDGPYAFNALGLPQGDPAFGDIRFGGYDFPNNSTTLAQTYFPPPNGTTAAGDVAINTSLEFQINSGYDLYSVVLHETGHSLGLDHPDNPSVVMAPRYGGVRTGLTTADIAGIQAIYGPRSPDDYHQRGVGVSFAAPIELSPLLASSIEAVVTGVSLAAIGQVAHYSLVAPTTSAGTLQVTAAAGGWSLLSPRVNVYDQTGRELATAAEPTAWSVDVTATVLGLRPGERYFITVTGATGDVFDTGAYELRLKLPGSSPPDIAPQPPPPPVPPIAPPRPPSINPDRYEPNDNPFFPSWLGRISESSIVGLSLHAASDVDSFSFQTSGTGTLLVTASGTYLQLFNGRGRLVGAGYGQVSVRSIRSSQGFTLRILPSPTKPVVAYDLQIAVRPASASSRRFLRPARAPLPLNPLRSPITPSANAPPRAI